MTCSLLYGAGASAHGRAQTASTAPDSFAVLNVFANSFSVSGGWTYDGLVPFGGLLQAADGNFYGTTSGGGANPPNVLDGCGGTGGCGTVFQVAINPVTEKATETVVHSMTLEDGIWPAANLIQGNDGYHFGTTYGPTLPTNGGMGTVFATLPGP